MPLQYFEQIDSTNDYIKENLSEFGEDFSGIYTFNQTKGRGMRGNIWVAEPEKNIALTFCLTDKNKSITPIYLSFWTAVIIRDFIESVTDIPASIKWPNDILVHKKKVCGILIEKSGDSYIIGMGINVMQENFDSLSKASSLLLLSSRKYSLPDLVENLIFYFKKNLNLLTDSSCLLEKYNSYLFGKNLIKSFKINNLELNGIIKKVDADGLLWVELEKTGIQKFRIKEIEFLY